MDGWWLAIASGLIMGWILMSESVCNQIMMRSMSIWKMIKHSRARSDDHLHELVPSPRGRLPFIGHLHQLLIMSGARSKLPHRWLHELSERHGPILRLQMGRVPMIVVSSPDLARLVLDTHDLQFASRSTYSSSVARFTYNFSSLGHTPYGPYWRKLKKLYMTKLFNTQRMQHFKPIRTEEMTRLVVAVWNDSSSHDIILHGGAQDVRMKLHVAASNVISRMTFGKSFEELSTTMRISGPAFCQTVYDSLKLMGAFDVNDFLPAFKFLDLQGFEQRAARVFQHLDVAIQRIVDDRRSNLRPSNHSNEKDFLDILLSSSTDEDVVKSSDSEPALSLTDDNIKAIVRDMIAGGINTSNYVVEWGLAELMHHKDIIKALQDEMDAVIGKDRLMREEDIANLPYLRATVKEILRFRPVVPLLPHHSINPCNINGFHIPTNTKVIINNWSLSMNEEYWDDPSQFRPQRFLDSNVDVKGHHYQLLPFGAGRRYCPAMNFSLTIIHLMLGSLIHCFKLSLPSEVDAIDMTEAFGLTMQMATPLVLVASPRFPSQFYESLVINQHI